MMSPSVLLKHQREMVSKKLTMARRHPEKYRGQIRTLKNALRDYDNALQLVTGKVPVNHEKPQGNDVKGVKLEMGFNFLSWSKDSKVIGFGIHNDEPIVWLDQSAADHDTEERKAYFVAAVEHMHAPAGYTAIEKLEMHDETFFIYAGK